jgi:hypothetical protein
MNGIIVLIHEDKLRIFDETKIIFELNLNDENTCGEFSPFCKRYYKIFNLPGIYNFLIQTKTYHKDQNFDEDRGSYTVDLFLFQYLKSNKKESSEEESKKEYKLIKLSPITFFDDNYSCPVIKISQFHPADIGHFICRDIRKTDRPPTFLVKFNVDLNNKQSEEKCCRPWTIVQLELPKSFNNFIGQCYKHFPFSKDYSADQIIFCGEKFTWIKDKEIPSSFSSYFDDQHIASWDGMLTNILTLEKKNPYADIRATNSVAASQSSGIAYYFHFDNLFRFVKKQKEEIKVEKVCPSLKISYIFWAKNDSIVISYWDSNVHNLLFVNLENNYRQILHRLEHGYKETKIVVNTSKYDTDFRNLILTGFSHLLIRELWNLVIDFCQ